MSNIAIRLDGLVLLLVFGAVLVGVLFFFYFVNDGPVASDVDWVDWFTVPWVFLFGEGCWRLMRVR